MLAEFERNGAKTLPLLPDAAKALPRYQRVQVQGRYDGERQFLLDAMPGSGGAGFHVLSVFRPNNSERALLVDRGWIPGGRDRGVLPALAVPEGEQVLRGRLATLPRPGIELEAEEGSASGWPRLVLFPRMDELERAASIRFYPLILWLDPELPGGFERDWHPVSGDPDLHIAYAVQWFGLAAALLSIFVVVNIERAPKEGAQLDQ